jgi:hypothetical protein
MAAELNQAGLVRMERQRECLSLAMNFLKSAAEPGNTVAPRSTNRAFITGSARPALISRLSRSMISAGVGLETRMARLGMAFAVVLTCAVPAAAADFPAPKGRAVGNDDDLERTRHADQTMYRRRDRSGHAGKC